jgi:hypothetical protein
MLTGDESPRPTHPLKVLLVAVCSAAYGASLLVSVRAISGLRESSAAFVFGSAILTIAILIGYLAIRRLKRPLPVALSIAMLCGALANLFLVGMTAVLAPLGG